MCSFFVVVSYFKKVVQIICSILMIRYLSLFLTFFSKNGRLIISYPRGCHLRIISRIISCKIGMLSQWPLVRFCTAHLLFYKLVLVTTRLNEVGLVCGLNLEDRATRTIATRVLNFVLCSVPSTLSWILDFGLI
jgi:hypothetical protein